MRSRVGQALKSQKTKHSIEYLGCDIETYKIYLSGMLQKNIPSKTDMTWENYGTVWHIDHIVPLKYENPTLEEIIKRLHYKNTQPLWAEDNLSKSNKYISWLQQVTAHEEKPSSQNLNSESSVG